MAVAAAIIVIATSAVGAAHAQPKKAAPVSGSLVYGQGNALWRVAAAGGEPTKIAELGFAATRITRIATNSGTAAGTIFLVSTESNHYWVATRPDRVHVVRHVCRGNATLSGDGNCVLCQNADSVITIERILPSAKKMTSPITGDLATLLGPKTRELVVVTANGVEAIRIARPKTRRVVAGVAPIRGLSVAPNGKHAVAQFGEAEDKGTGLYVFTLTGENVRRKLVSNAELVSWSRDSQWLVVNEAKRGCVVRASGGQYRCFDGFRGVGLAPNHKEALLAKGKVGAMTLFRVDLGGAHSKKPVLLLKGVQGAAIWLK